MPAVYLIDDTALNAFATGRDPQHSSIAVTTGILARLDREELQGVVGHELSHVRNYDIRYAMLVGVLVGTIALLADVFLRMTFWGGTGRRSSSSDRGGGGLQALVLIFAILLAILAPFFGRLVQLAVTRQREYLADASSVELTRNPYGLQRALAVIAEDQRGPRGRQPRHPAPLLPQSDPQVRVAFEGALLDPPADRRPHQSPADAHRRGADRRGRHPGRRGQQLSPSRSPSGAANAPVAGGPTREVALRCGWPPLRGTVSLADGRVTSGGAFGPR